VVRSLLSALGTAVEIRGKRIALDPDMKAAHLFRAALGSTGVIAAALGFAQEPRFRERVEVDRVLLDVRVVDAAGRAVRGLGPEDFRVEVDGRRVAVESAQWVSGQPLGPDEVADLGLPPAPPGRLIVFFFQKDLFEPSRIGGLLKMVRSAEDLLETLEPDDRVAVLSFDSHLRLWQDFTGNRTSLARALQAVLFDERASFDPCPFPALEPSFDAAAARRAATPEVALRVTAEALQAIPGSKSLVLFGWGLGRFTAGLGVRMTPDYGPARHALVDARTSVFALDVTNADYHSLEVGLEQVAEDTGGFYAKTHLFPDQAMSRLEGALAGHYVLAIEKPPGKPGRHRVSVKRVGGPGTVLARDSYVD
jgi:VWFA-related protein